jgi:hypothetical protein
MIAAAVTVLAVTAGTLLIRPHAEAPAPSPVTVNRPAPQDTVPQAGNSIDITAERLSSRRSTYPGLRLVPVIGSAGSSLTIDVTMTIPPQTGFPSPWQPPIGIPTPTFGIDQSHTLYEDQTFDYGSGPAPYNDAGNGPYTHYVDNTSPAATDTSNPFGTAEKPRKTIPTRPVAGSVIEVHGGPYGPAEIILVAQGTPEKPIFLRGINKPRIAGKLTVYSSAGIESRYLVIEGFDVYKCWALAPTSYLAYRDNNIQGDAANGGIAMDSYNSAYSNHHIVVYRNRIHDNGDWQADYDQDVHGITVARYSNNVWIVDNEMYHNSGDGLQINAGSISNQPHTHHIYVGRNLSYENKQAGMWTKQAVDVIFSQNTVHSLRPIGTTPSAYGAGMGFQYGPERVWFLYNHIYNCSYGISTGSTSAMGSGQDVYCIGNLIHDIHHHPDYAYSPTSSWSNAAITLVGTTNRYIINNTIVNCDAGINSPSSGTMVMVNNIISNITEPQGNHIFVDVGSTAAVSTLSCSLLYQGGNPVRIRWGSGTVYDLPAFQAATGKGAGCLAADPIFVDPAAGDYRLQPDSPAIDRAELSAVYATFQSLYGLGLTTDSAGTARPQGDAWDIGAMECPVEAP